MKIKSTAPKYFMFAGCQINPGVDNYDIDYKNPFISAQLKVLRDDAKVIEFKEALPCDLDEKQKEAYDAKLEARAKSDADNMEELIKAEHAKRKKESDERVKALQEKAKADHKAGTRKPREKTAKKKAAPNGNDKQNDKTTGRSGKN